MRELRINRLSGGVMIVLSLATLLLVLCGYTLPLLPDEGAAAHLFQLFVVVLVPTIVVFLATEDWTRPRRSAMPLAFSAATLILAFGALYYLEHYR